MKTLVFVLFFILSLPGLFYIFLEYYPVCDNELKEELIVGNDKKLIVFKRMCGIGAGDITHVSFVGKNKELGINWVGNLYISDETNITINIVDEMITIRIEPEKTVYKAIEELEGFKIIYKDSDS